MKTMRRMFVNSMLVSICVVGALIAALLPAPLVTADSPESGFHISQWTGETWEEIYHHQFQVQYSTEAFTVDVVDGKVVLRIVQVGTPFADVDQITLMADGEELIPEYGRYVATGVSILEDVLELDHNVVIAHEQEIEASWDVPAGYGGVTVYLTANEYGHGLPFQFPETGYATYEIGSNTGSIDVDGSITETDGTIPLYSPYWQPSSGHPDGYTYIYVCDDEQYVYFSLDVTIDNTNEFGEDWAEIRILQPDGSEQAFRIDDFDNTWGESGFGLTSKVSYKHQTCEFAIPKSILEDENIEFNLAYYGTASVPGYVYANADVDPLVIEINGDPSPGQVFNVGDMIDVEGFVHSIANATVYSGGYLLETTLSCELWLGPGGLEYDSYSDWEDNDGSPSTTSVEIEYDGNLSFTHTLTTPGEYTITLNSDAGAYVSYLDGNPIMGTSSDPAQQLLSFTVVRVDVTFTVDPMAAPNIAGIILGAEGLGPQQSIGKGKNRTFINLIQLTAAQMGPQTLFDGVEKSVISDDTETCNPEYWDAVLAFLNDRIAYYGLGIGPLTYSLADYIADQGTPGVIFEEDFTDVPGTTIPVGWNETAAYPNWEVWGYAYAGGSLPEMRFTWSPAFTGISRSISPEIDATAYSNIELTFKHFVDNYDGGYDLKVQVSLDGGTTWADSWSISPTGDIGPETVTVALSGYDGQSFTLAWVFDGYSYHIDYWYIDDILVTGY